MSFRQRVAGLKKGLVIGTAVNNQDFWGISFGRPTAFLLLAVVGDMRIMTPNRITHISNLLFVTGALLILYQTPAAYIAAAILINLSLTFDCADGQLARYRGGGSELGAYYDKVSDYFGLCLLCGVLGWVATQETGEPYHLLLAICTMTGLLSTGYIKWVAMAAIYRRGGATGTAPAATGEERSMPWWEFAGRVFLKIFRFAEPDMFFWLALALLLDKLPWLLWFYAVTQLPVGIAAAIHRAMQMADLDRQKIG